VSIQELTDREKRFQALCNRASRHVSHAIETLLEDDISKRVSLYLIVANPFFHSSSIDKNEWERQNGVIFKKPFGHGSDKYSEIATSKGFMGWQHRQPSQVIQEQMSFLVGPGDTQYWGSEYRYGLTVASSGNFPILDTLCSSWFLDTIRCLSIHERNLAIEGDGVKGGFFVW